MKDLRDVFIKIFGDGGEIRYFHAPGRINIIGEHIDYNGGYVLPCATDMGTYALIRKNNSSLARFASKDFEGIVNVPLDNVTYDSGDDWANYPKGVVAMMQQDGHKFDGFDVLFCGNIPAGAGLSSSASIEMAMAVALNALHNLDYTMIDMVKLAQRAENIFCGVNCGIMDQFAVGMGKKDCAIYLHCDTLDYSQVPLVLDGYKMLIMNTNKRRQLSESKYNERRAQCEQALALLSQANDIRCLADLTPEEFEASSHLITDKTIYNRAKHVVNENNRVKQAVEALKAGDINTLGKLLNQSHASLRDDYEVSCQELDTIVSAAISRPACIGARMMGAGFGGCAIALVQQDAIEDFIEVVSKAYEDAIGYAPSIFAAESGDGAREVTES